MSGQVLSQALHWLSQPDVSVGDILNKGIDAPKVSANGRYISFISSASNLVENDTNGLPDVFIRDTLLGTTQRVNVTAGGAQMTDSILTAFTAPTSDGRYVAFETASDIFPDSTSFGDFYPYVKDLQTGAVVNQGFFNGTERFETRFSDLFLSDDGRYLVFTSSEEIDPLDTSFGRDVYRKDIQTGVVELLTVSADGLAVGNDDSKANAVSPNGQYVLIESEATNLVNETLNNGRENLYLRDLNTGNTSLVNRTASGDPSSCDEFSIRGTVANNGWVAFISGCDDLVSMDTNELNDVFLFNGSTIQRIDLAPGNQQLTDNSQPGIPSISLDGSRIAYSHSSDLLSSQDSNSLTDVYLYNTTNQTHTLISTNMSGVASSGFSVGAVISANGQTIAFVSSATDLTSEAVFGYENSLFSYDVNSGVVSNQSEVAFAPNTVIRNINTPTISSDQKFALYSSQSPNLLPVLETNTLNDLLLLDRDTNTRHVISRNVLSFHNISKSGRYVLFYTRFFPPAGTLDLNGNFLFLLDRDTGSYTQIAENAVGEVNNQGLVFFSSFSGLVGNDTNGNQDVYVFDSSDQSIALISEAVGGNAGNSGSALEDISETNGTTFVVFQSAATDLINLDQNGRTDVFMREWPGGNIIRISQTPAGVGGGGTSRGAAITPDGGTVVFISSAQNLTADDYSNATGEQVFSYNTLDQTIALRSKSNTGLPLNENFDQMSNVGISDSGRYIAFDFDGDVAFLSDSDRRNDVFLLDTFTDNLSLVSKKLNGQQISETATLSAVVEDLSLSPPLVGVLFTTDGGALVEIDEHPQYREAFLYQQGGPNVDLDVIVDGPGGVSGTLGLNCQNSCAFDYPLGTELSIVASADQGAVFVGWTVDFGNCGDGFNPCSLRMDRSKTLMARFVDSSDLIFNDGFD
ncbi:hypothetical protein [Marinicella sp. W31]|uniref:hypothetical protein n=1 Tax=Marinicella sp. W31 TaxID=3023713 RepID=UPI0037580640